MRIVGQITEAQQEEPAAKGQRDEQPQRAIQKNRGDRFGAPGGMGVRRVNRARKVAAAGAKQKRIENFKIKIIVGLTFGNCRWLGDYEKWEERPTKETEKRYILNTW